ncbi:MAG: segregation/condensation protein A [Parachlamydiaceae bacterium]|nr:segregation/condensation protein A [Parachlamydiaceae bacterium]
MITSQRSIPMKLLELNSFSIDNFEGPLDLLWQLIQRNEVDIYQVSLHEITNQYVKKARALTECNLDEGAEFIASTAALLWLKSKTLLPKNEQQEPLTEDEYDPRFEVIHQLVDYCRFRQAAKELAEREQHQSSFFVRGVEESEARKNLGIAHLSLDDLAMMFRQVLSKAQTQKGSIYEEEWQVGDKTSLIRLLLSKQTTIPFAQLFNSEKSREELIVIFLALLELMKAGEARVVRDPNTETISIVQPTILEATTDGQRN